jgi:hypothetical protein
MEGKIGRDLEGNGRGILETIFSHFPGRSEEYDEYLQSE